MKKNTIRAMALVLGLSLFSFVGCTTEDREDPNEPYQETEDKMQNNEEVEMNNDEM